MTQLLHYNNDIIGLQDYHKKTALHYAGKITEDNDWLTDWTTDCLSNWWLTLTHWRTHPPTDWLTDQLTGWLTHSLTQSLAYILIHSLTYWLTHSFIHQPTHWMTVDLRTDKPTNWSFLWLMFCSFQLARVTMNVFSSLLKIQKTLTFETRYITLYPRNKIFFTI